MVLKWVGNFVETSKGWGGLLSWVFVKRKKNPVQKPLTPTSFSKSFQSNFIPSTLINEIKNKFNFLFLKCLFSMSISDNIYLNFHWNFCIDQDQIKAIFSEIIRYWFQWRTNVIWVWKCQIFSLALIFASRGTLSWISGIK